MKMMIRFLMSIPGFHSVAQTTQAGVRPAGMISQTHRMPVSQAQQQTIMQQKAAAQAAQNKAAAAQQQQIRTPLSTLGPSSSKVLNQASRAPPSQAKVQAKGGGASAAVTAALQAHAAKQEPSTAASHKEKRKFESLK